MFAPRSPWTLPPDPLTAAERSRVWFAHLAHLDADRKATAEWQDTLGGWRTCTLWEHPALPLYRAPTDDGIGAHAFPVLRPDLLPERLRDAASAEMRRRGSGLLLHLRDPAGGLRLAVLWGQRREDSRDAAWLWGESFRRNEPRAALHTLSSLSKPTVVWVVEGMRNTLCAQSIARWWGPDVDVLGVMGMEDTAAWVGRIVEAKPRRVLLLQSRDGYRAPARTAAAKALDTALRSVCPVQAMGWADLAAASGAQNPVDLTDVVRAAGGSWAAQAAVGMALRAQEVAA